MKDYGLQMYIFWQIRCIVVSYHPYQIGAFLEGDYHILVPFKNIGEYLLQDISFIYSDQDTQKW